MEKGRQSDLRTRCGREGEKERDRDRETERDREIETDTETERQTDRETETERAFIASAPNHAALRRYYAVSVIASRHEFSPLNSCRLISEF